MVRRLVGAFALTCVLSSAVAPGVAGDSARSLPMQFVLRHEGPASACADKCRVWVSATGVIKAETSAAFEAFAQRNNIRGATLALDSEGGSVVGAIALGRLIRAFDMTTTVGKTIELPAVKGEGPRATLSPRADCESMCPFVLLGGTKRVVPPEARVRVHQIWLGDRREDASAATYSAEDLVLVQRDIGKLALYTMEMGGGADLLEVSLRIPPWEPMRALTRDELRRMKLDTLETTASQPDALPTGSVKRSAAPTPATGTASLRRTSAGAEGGWTMSARAGTTVLARHHPLTVEGAVIGGFDVALTCGTTPGEFGILYSETRRSVDGALSPTPIKDVEISVGMNTTPLTISASELENTLRRNSSAAGVLPLAVLKNFVDASSRSMTIETLSADDSETSIRIGNTGLAQYFPQLTAFCAQHAMVTHAGLTPAAR